MAGTGKGPLRIAIEDFIKTSPLGDAIRGWFFKSSENLEQAIYRVMPEYFNLLANDPKIDQYFHLKAVINKAPGHGVVIIPMLLMIIGGVFGIIIGSFQPIARALSYQVDKGIRSNRLTAVEAIQVIFRDPASTQAMKDALRDQGYGEEDINRLTSIFVRRVPDDLLLQQWLRKNISDLVLNDELQRRGYNGGEIERLKQSTKVIPGVQDLVRLAVREAWNDQVAARFQYDADLPGEVGEWGAKQGLDPDWIKRYWRAHWELPSPTMAYEMVHRLRPGKTQNPFTLDDMRLLLRTADYPPFWRDRLIEVSYNPYTRVDVRRMYKLGILDKQAVYDSYRDLGYDDVHAKNLTDFTIKYETGSDETKPDKMYGFARPVIINAYQDKLIDRGTAKSMILSYHIEEDEAENTLKIADLQRLVELKPDYEKEYISNVKKLVTDAYVSRIISKDEATKGLKDIGLSDIEASHILANSDYEYNHATLYANLKAVSEGYINGSFDYTQVVQQLGKLNISGAQQGALFAEWDITKKTRTRRLTEAQYRSAFVNNLLTRDQYRQAMVDLGYSDRDVELLVKLYATPRATAG
jgi:hypothetical protein